MPSLPTNHPEIQPRTRSPRARGIIFALLVGVFSWTACKLPMVAPPTAPDSPPADVEGGDSPTAPATETRPEATGPEGQASVEPIPRPLRRPYQDLRRHTFQSIGEDTGIDVSPDGKSLLYSSSQTSQKPKIHLKEKGSALIRSLTTGGYSDIHPKFSPAGDEVAFASDREGNFDVWVVALDSPSVAEQITSSADDEVHPTFSPDGKRIAFCRRTPRQGWTIWIQHRERQDLMELGPGLFPEWSPAGDWIAFQKASERGDRWYGIWVVRPDGSEVRQVIAFDEFGAIQPTWSPTAEQIAFTTVYGDAGRSGAEGWPAAGKDIMIVDLRTGRNFQLTHHEGSNWSPAWGLDGEIYFTSDRYEGRNLLSLTPPEVKEL